ncbi:unnamed protein product [Rhizoctonia solani]|uniref:Uncharacterized protein n=1 Tax=Rhizoctonia solani TaxID=456999 RepID=A0A8H3CT23_9AGAM|nr:unnamed protein product [Rhizoctonia solani]
MRLFGKKKSNTAIQDDPPSQPPSISRPRAQGHLPPTTAPKPPTSRRSFPGQTSGEPVTTPLYARFARTDSFENLGLRAKPTDSRSPSYAPTQQELEEDAQRLGYDRPWARELLNSLDGPDPLEQPSVRMVSNPSTKPSTDKRVSLDAVAAKDPFMASKMQSIMRRAPSNARAESTPTTPKRSVTAPPLPNPPTSPPPRVPTAPPTRSVSAKSTAGPKSPSRPSFDDDDSTFSHSHTGHQTQPRPAYPSAGATGTGVKRERGPPPVAGTHSAYAWRSGQSDDGHGGSNFYTGGSQSAPAPPVPVPPSSFNGFLGSLPPGAAPPDPSGHKNPNNPLALKKRTPSNPPTNRTPAPQGHARRMSMENNARPLSGGPGTWGGSAIASVGAGERGRDRAPAEPTSSAGPNAYGVPNTTYGDLSRAPTVRSVQPGEIFHHPGTIPMPPPQAVSAPYQAVSAPMPPPKVVSPPPPANAVAPPAKVAPPQPAKVVAPPQPAKVVSPAHVQGQGVPPPPAKTVSPPSVAPAQAQAPRPVPQPRQVTPPQPTSAGTFPPPLQALPASQPQRQTTTSQPPRPQPALATSAVKKPVPGLPPGAAQPTPGLPQGAAHSTPGLPPSATQPTPGLPPGAAQATPGLPPGAAPASPTGYKHAAYGPTYSAYGPTPGSAYGSVGPSGNVKGSVGNVNVNAGGSVGGNGNVGQVKGQVPESRGGTSQTTVASQVPDPRASQASDFRKSQASDVRTIQAQDRRASQLPERASQVESRPRQLSESRPGQLSESRPSHSSEARPSPTSRFIEGRSSPTKPTVANQLTASPVGGSPPKSESGWSRSVAVESAGSVRTVESPAPGRATPTPPNANLSVQDARNSSYSGASSVSVVPPSTPLPPASPSKATFAPTTPSKSVPRSATSSPVRNRELPHPPGRPGPSPLAPSSLREQSVPPRAPSSMSVSSYGTALPLESEPGSEVAPASTKLALGGLAINTATPRSGSPTPTPSSAAPTSAMVTARMTPTTTAALSPATIPSLASNPPQHGLAPPRAVSPTPTASTTRMDEPSESDAESMYKKRNRLVKTRKMDGASSFRSSDERSERPVSVVQPESPGPGLGLNGGEDPFARAPPTIVKSTRRVHEPAPKRAMPLSPPLSSDDHDMHPPNSLDAQRDDKSPMTPALTDEAPATDEQEEELAEPESTTPPGSPPPPKIYPLETHLNMPSLLAALLPYLSFRDWNALNALNAGLRRQLEETRALREEVLEYWLRGVGYARWKAQKREPLMLTLRDLNAYMRGVSIAVYRYSAIAESFLAIRAQQEQTRERVPGAASKGNLVRALASSCRAYTKVILRLREQAELMHPEGDFRSPLFKAGGAPLLRVFVPSKEGAWLSDTSVLDCEKELKRAGALGVLRIGDVIWDAAVGDEGNAGRMVWDGNYLVDLDYTYSTTGELPKYIHSLAFSPSYWHKIIRTSNSPLCHIDLAPYAAEIASSLHLVQDRVQTETPQGGRHTVVRWVHRSRFHTRPGLPLPGASPPAVVDRMWDGYIVVEVEGTNEGLADLQARVGNTVRLFPAKTAGMELSPPTGKSPFRLLRSSSRPGEIWIRAVREKERLG